jgi:hypothetical protein
MSTFTFLDNDNVQMLWEVIIDDPSVAQNSTTQQVFTRIVPEFYEREKSKYKNLMEMNKKFISLIMNSFNSQRQPIFQSPPTKQPFKAEDIQAERLNAFEKGLAEKKNDFLSFLTSIIVTF